MIIIYHDTKHEKCNIEMWYCGNEDQGGTFRNGELIRVVMKKANMNLRP